VTDPDLLGSSPLRAALEEAVGDYGGSLQDYTVLANQNDPFRLDTPANHRDGEWLAIQALELGLGSRQIHLRGLHYALLGRSKPDGTPYINDDDHWEWLQGHPAKAARWLGYIPFERIVDQRNAAPVVRIFKLPEPEPAIASGVDVELPDADDIAPVIEVDDFVGVQPYHIVLWGEKSSLEEVLGPISKDHKADLYLPTGEISDTLLHLMAQVGATDGRPMIVLVFADADPGGWQMAISIARKLQAFKIRFFPDLEFKVYRVALTPDQVREHGLPSTPLKATELRADRWREAWGVEQTEIDALASLRPELLRQIALKAITHFYDYDLDDRVDQAREEWLEAAQVVLDEHLAGSGVEETMNEAREKLAVWRADIEAINERLAVDVDVLDLPEIEIPEAEVDGEADDLLLVIDSDEDFAEQCRLLINSKQYGLEPVPRLHQPSARQLPPEPGPPRRRLVRQNRTADFRATRTPDLSPRRIVLRRLR
jgi:hypothetical protein